MINKIDIQRYLQRFDISPDRLPIDGLGPEGYQRYRRTDAGQAIYLPGTRTFAREFLPWPEGFEYETLQHLLDGGKLSDKEGTPKQTPPAKEDPKIEKPTKAKASK